jgi:hypothetical protein
MTSIAGGGRHQSPIRRASGTLTKLLVMYSSGMNTRNVAVVVASEEHEPSQSGHFNIATAVGALGCEMS